MSNVQTVEKVDTVNVRKWLWVLMAVASALFFLNSLVNSSVRTSIEDIKERMNLDDVKIQVACSSAAYFLTPPLSIVGSVMVDKIGVSRSILIFSIGSLTGWVLFCTALSFRSFWFLTLSRMIHGGSLGALVVAVNYFCIYWFESRGLMSACLGSFRMLNGIAGAISPLIVSDLLTRKVFHLPITTVNWVLCVVLGLSLLCGLALVSLSSYLDKVLNQINKETKDNDDGHQRTSVELADVPKITEIESGNVGETSHPIETETEENKKHDTPKSDDQVMEQTDDCNTGIRTYFNMISTLLSRPCFITLLLTGLCLEASTISFLNLVRSFMQRFLGIPPSKIGTMMMLLRIPGLLSPLVGLTLDRFFHESSEIWHLFCLIVSGLTVVIGHTVTNMAGTEQTTGMAGLIVLGCGYVAYEICFWTCVPDVSHPTNCTLKLECRRKMKIVALGLVSAVLSCGTIAFPIIGGSITDSHDGSDESKKSAFQKAHFLFLFLGVAGVLFSMVLFFLRWSYMRANKKCENQSVLD